MAYAHEHKFFVFQVKADFIPLIVTGESIEEFKDLGEIYQRVENAVLGCSCGEVIKRRVKNADAMVE